MITDISSNKLSEEELKELWSMIRYSTRKNIQYGDYLFDKIKNLNDDSPRREARV